MNMTWDRIRILDWSRASKPQPFVLSASDMGCGCCADGETVYTKQEAMALVSTHIAEREQELAVWRRWLSRMETATEIVDVHD